MKEFKNWLQTIGVIGITVVVLYAAWWAAILLAVIMVTYLLKEIIFTS